MPSLPIVLPILQHVVDCDVVSEEDEEIHAHRAGDADRVLVKHHHCRLDWTRPRFFELVPREMREDWSRDAFVLSP